MNTAVATQKKPSAVATVHDFFAKRKDELAKVYAGNVDQVLNAVDIAMMKDPKIAEASMESLYREVKLACNDGLKLDGREAALTRINANKRFKDDNGRWQDNFVTEVLYIPMVAGIMKRVRNTGEIASWSAELVYQREYETGRFTYVAAPEPLITHQPIIVGERGPIVAAYSAVRLRDGTMHYEVMNIDQLNGIRNRSKSKQNDGSFKGPWATDIEEMYRKTVIRRHSKRLPVASELTEVARRVDSLYDMDASEYSATEETAAEVPTPVAKARKASAAAVMQRAAKEAQQPDPHGGQASEPDEVVTVDGEILGPDDYDKSAPAFSGDDF